jgi:hypothetical protein
LRCACVCTVASAAACASAGDGNDRERAEDRASTATPSSEPAVSPDGPVVDPDFAPASPAITGVKYAEADAPTHHEGLRLPPGDSPRTSGHRGIAGESRCSRRRGRSVVQSRPGPAREPASAHHAVTPTARPRVNSRWASPVPCHESGAPVRHAPWESGGVDFRTVSAPISAVNSVPSTDAHRHSRAHTQRITIIYDDYPTDM